MVVAIRLTFHVGSTGIETIGFLNILKDFAIFVC